MKSFSTGMVEEMEKKKEENKKKDAELLKK